MKRKFAFFHLFMDGNIRLNHDVILDQFGTQVKFRWSRDHNNRTADNAFSAPWYFSEMELEPVAG